MKIILETVDSTYYTHDTEYMERLGKLGFKCFERDDGYFDIEPDSIEIEMNTIEELMKFVEEVSPPSPHNFVSLGGAVIVGNGKIILYDDYIE